LNGKLDFLTNLLQRTLKAPIHCTGAGLHTNAKVSMALLPAPPDTGIVFRRTDLGANAEIKAHCDNVIDSRLCTTIGDGNGVSIGTVEHLMAAFAGCGVDNAFVEVSGAEIPIMDGSARPFVFLLECAGIVEQNAPRKAIRILKRITVGNDACWATIMPSDRFSMRCEIVFDNHAIGTQSFSYDSQKTSFVEELSHARTFCLAEDVEKMRAAGLALGGSLDNAVVIGEHGLLNEEGLRYETEFVRHKALDCIGDLSLAGAALLGHVECYCTGHAMNYQLLATLLADEDAWCWTEAEAHTSERGDAAPQVRHAAVAASA
tara:strand:+ start:150 stop:1103 length:954 start_codon:yes stop_codon:yes gene_type:complete